MDISTEMKWCLKINFCSRFVLQTMKEIMGVPRPHLVEDFLHSLHSKMAATSGPTGVVELPQVYPVAPGISAIDNSCCNSYRITSCRV